MQKLNKEKIKNLINLAYKIGWASYALKIEKLVQDDNLEESYRIMFSAAVDNNNIEVIKYLIKDGIDINIDDGYMLRMSCVFGNKEMVKLLLKNKANIHIKGNSPFIYSVNNGEIDVIKMLWKIGKKEYLSNEQVLERAFLPAAEFGHLTVIQYMIEDLKLTNPDFINKVLKKAALSDKLSIVEYLIFHGGDIHLLKKELNPVLSEQVNKWCDKYIAIEILNKKLNDSLSQKDGKVVKRKM